MVELIGNYRGVEGKKNIYLRPQIEGKISSFPTPGFMQATSYSESSGLKEVNR